MKNFEEFLIENKENDNGVEIHMSSEVYSVVKGGAGNTYFETRYVSQLEIIVNKNMHKLKTEVLHLDLSDIFDNNASDLQIATIFLNDINKTLMKNKYPKITAREVEVGFFHSDAALLKHKRK